MARVLGMVAARSYNIESLTVAEIDAPRGLSRINILLAGTPRIVEQIRMQLGRIISVHEVGGLSFVFEVVGSTQKVDAFIELMRPLGLAEVSRTGIAAIARGAGVGPKSTAKSADSGLGAVGLR